MFGSTGRIQIVIKQILINIQIFFILFLLSGPLKKSSWYSNTGRELYECWVA